MNEFFWGSLMRFRGVSEESWEIDGGPVYCRGREDSERRLVAIAHCLPTGKIFYLVWIEGWMNEVYFVPVR